MPLSIDGGSVVGQMTPLASGQTLENRDVENTGVGRAAVSITNTLVKCGPIECSGLVAGAFLTFAAGAFTAGGTWLKDQLTGSDTRDGPPDLLDPLVYGLGAAGATGLSLAGLAIAYKTSPQFAQAVRSVGSGLTNAMRSAESYLTETVTRFTTGTTRQSPLPV